MAANPKRITTFAQAALYTVIVIAILAAINFLANRYNKSYDTTTNKRYTLSDQTVKIAKDLKQDVTISFWDRPEFFEPASDLLNRYDQLSPRLKVVYEDIEKNRLGAIAAKIESRPAVTVATGNKIEHAKSLTEEEITGALVRVLKGGDRTLCFTAGYGEPELDDSQNPGYAGAKEVAERANYKTKVVTLIPLPDISKDCTVLVVAGPKRNYLPPVIDAIKKYVEDGGRALILLDPPLKIGSQVDDNAALVALLRSWGVQLNADLVLDMSGIGQFFNMGPEFPVITEYESHPIVRVMRDMATAFPLARSMTTVPSEKAEVEPLLQTSDSSLITTDLQNQRPQIDPSTKGARILAVAGEMNPPEDAPPSTDGSGPPIGRFVVVGTSTWIANNALGFNGNRDLYMNMVNWLSKDEDLIAISPKDPIDRRLNMNERQINLMFLGSVVGLPVLMFLAAFSVWWRRR